MKTSNVLVVEGDPDLAHLLTGFLADEGYAVTVADRVAKMKDAFGKQEPDVMILDVALPDGTGWSALRWFRERSHVPVMMLVGRDDVVDKVAGVELGADDCVSKPFETGELLARLRMIQRRSAHVDMPAAPSDGSMRFHGFEIDINAQGVRDESGTPVKLTPAEYQILLRLARAPGEVVTRARLMVEVAGRDWDPSDRSIDVHVSNLRRKLGVAARHANLIRSARGVGYMLMATGDREPALNRGEEA